MITGIFPFGCVWCVSQIWGPKAIIFTPSRNLWNKFWKKIRFVAESPYSQRFIMILKAGIFYMELGVATCLGRHQRQGGPATCGAFHGLGSVSFEARSGSCHWTDEDSGSYPYYIDHLWSNLKIASLAFEISMQQQRLDLHAGCQEGLLHQKCIAGNMSFATGRGKDLIRIRKLVIFYAPYFSKLSMPGLNIIPSLCKIAGAFVD